MKNHGGPREPFKICIHYKIFIKNGLDTFSSFLFLLCCATRWSTTCS